MGGTFGADVGVIGVDDDLAIGAAPLVVVSGAVVGAVTGCSSCWSGPGRPGRRTTAIQSPCRGWSAGSLRVDCYPSKWAALSTGKVHRWADPPKDPRRRRHPHSATQSRGRAFDSGGHVDIDLVTMHRITTLRPKAYVQEDHPVAAVQPRLAPSRTGNVCFESHAFNTTLAWASLNHVQRIT